MIRRLLLAAALLASGCVSRPVEPSSPPATRSASPTATATAPPSVGGLRSPVAVDVESPSTTDEPVPSAAGPEIVVSIPSQFGDLRVRIDSDGLIVDGRAATAADLARINLGERDIAVRNLQDQRLLVVWIGTICERSARLVVVPEEVFLAPDPRPGCDAMAFGWGLVLTTRDPLDAARMVARQSPTILLP